MAELSLSPRSLTTAVLPALLAAVVALCAACSSSDSPHAASSSSTTAGPSPTATAATVTVRGLPSDLGALITRLYAGGAVPVTGGVGAALTKRTIPPGPVTASGRVRTWKKTPIAVVISGKDATLLVKAPTWRVVGGWWPSLGLPKRLPAATMRVLAIGTDARPGHSVTAARADSLHIIGVDQRGVGGLLGIPRDSWVSLSTGGKGKINSAMLAGGPRAQVSTVRSLSGVKIDGYLMTGFIDFREMVDKMHGIRYTAAAALTSHRGVLLLKKGVNVLNGLTALNFARERHHVATGDFGRSANQGRLIKAGMAMAKARDASHLPEYLAAMSPHVQTSLTAEQILTLASALYVTNPGSVPNVVVPGSNANIGGQSAVVLGGGAQTLFRDMRDGRLS